MKNKTIAIIGATGKTGSRVLTKLQQQGHQVRGLSRDSEQPFDWNNQAGWAEALRGADAAYVTYYPDLAVPQAESDIRDFVQLAEALNLKHLVLLSGRGEEGAQRAEQVVKDSVLDWNIVRASWFMQNFSESFMLEGLQAGELVLPEPKATEPFIDVNDIVDVVVATLTRKELRNQLLEITGPELLSFRQCVAAIAAIAGRKIELITAPIEAYLAGAKGQGVPEDIAWLINELFVNVLDGRNENTTNTIERVLDRKARTFNDYIASTVQTGVWKLS